MNILGLVVVWGLSMLYTRKRLIEDFEDRVPLGLVVLAVLMGPFMAFAGFMAKLPTITVKLR